MSRPLSQPSSRGIPWAVCDATHPFPSPPAVDQPARLATTSDAPSATVGLAPHNSVSRRPRSNLGTKRRQDGDAGRSIIGRRPSDSKRRKTSVAGRARARGRGSERGQRCVELQIGRVAAPPRHYPRRPVRRDSKSTPPSDDAIGPGASGSRAAPRPLDRALSNDLAALPEPPRANLSRPLGVRSEKSSRASMARERLRAVDLASWAVESGPPAQRSRLRQPAEQRQRPTAFTRC